MTDHTKDLVDAPLSRTDIARCFREATGASRMTPGDEDFARRVERATVEALASTSLTVGERGAPLDVTLDEAQAKVLRDHIVIGDDDDDVAPIRLLVGSGHSGYGLYLAQAEYQDEGSVLLHEMPTPAPMKAADEFELRRLLSEERETTRQLTRALAEATEGSTFMGEPVVPSNPPAQNKEQKT